jgi:hypothetical protein
MERIQINSSDLKSVGYDPVKHTLEIEFNNGEVIQYVNVPEKIYSGLMRTESQAKYINALIKNIYKSCRV